MSILEEILTIVGDIPSAYMPLAWVFAAVFLLFIVSSFFSLLAAILRFISGGAS